MIRLECTFVKTRSSYDWSNGIKFQILWRLQKFFSGWLLKKNNNNKLEYINTTIFEEGYYHNYFWHYPRVDIVEVVGISLVVFVFLILKMGLFLCHVTNKKNYHRNSRLLLELKLNVLYPISWHRFCLNQILYFIFKII